MDREVIHNALSQIQLSLRTIQEQVEDDDDDHDDEINQIDCMESDLYELGEMLGFKEDEF